jgi:hypothetical protein
MSGIHANRFRSTAGLEPTRNLPLTGWKSLTAIAVVRSSRMGLRYGALSPHGESYHPSQLSTPDTLRHKCYAESMARAEPFTGDLLQSCDTGLGDHVIL